jgi:hypothetical protein
MSDSESLSQALESFFKAAVSLLEAICFFAKRFALQAPGAALCVIRIRRCAVIEAEVHELRRRLNHTMH